MDVKKILIKPFLTALWTLFKHSQNTWGWQSNPNTLSDILEDKHTQKKRGSREENFWHLDLRYADDTTLTAESEEELKSLLMKVKEKSEKVGLKHSEN